MTFYNFIFQRYFQLEDNTKNRFLLRITILVKDPIVTGPN